LIPALRRGRARAATAAAEHWRIATFRPTERPFEELAERVPSQLAPMNANLASKTKSWREHLPVGGSALRDEIVNLVGCPGAIATMPESAW
jgi:hypothetical protein